jgi:hypothetical protein
MKFLSLNLCTVRLACCMQFKSHCRFLVSFSSSNLSRPNSFVSFDRGIRIELARFFDYSTISIITCLQRKMPDYEVVDEMDYNQIRLRSNDDKQTKQ